MGIVPRMATLGLVALSATAAMASAAEPVVRAPAGSVRGTLVDGQHVFCRRRAAGTVPWNWNVGVTAPVLPPAQETCR